MKRDNRLSYNIKENKVDIKFDMDTLTWFCQYVLTESDYVHLAGLTALRRLLDKINPDVYSDNPQSLSRYYFCMEAIKSKLDKNLTNRNFIIEDVLGTIGNKFPDLQPDDFKGLSDDEMTWIENNVISSYLTNTYVIKQAQKIKDAALQIQIADPESIQDAANKFRDLIEETHVENMKNKIDPDENKNELNMSEDNDNNLMHIIEEAKRPSRMLKTGINYLNKMLNGGFESARVYSFFAIPGEGKSLTLKEMAYEIIKYNKGYVCRDKTKKPCVLFLSMENQPAEDLQTFLNIAGYNIDMQSTDKSASDILKMFKESIYTPKEEGDINFVFEYRPIYSINTSWIPEKIESLKDKGYEVIAVLQDYIYRILPVYNPNDEERLKLGTIINEFKNCAIKYQIPILTASQINREGIRMIKEKRKEGKFEDVMNTIDSFYIGESSKIDENIDCSLFLIPFEIDNRKYLGIKATKRRFKNARNIEKTISKFYQPYHIENRAKLMEDATIPQTYGLLSLQGTVTDYFSETPIKQKIETNGGFIDSPNNLKEPLFMIKDLTDKAVIDNNINKYFKELKELNKPIKMVDSNEFVKPNVSNMKEAFIIMNPESTSKKVIDKKIREYLVSYGIKY